MCSNWKFISKYFFKKVFFVSKFSKVMYSLAFHSNKLLFIKCHCLLSCFCLRKFPSGCLLTLQWFGTWLICSIKNTRRYGWLAGLLITWHWYFGLLRYSSATSQYEAGEILGSHRWNTWMFTYSCYLWGVFRCNQINKWGNWFWSGCRWKLL